MKYIFTVFILFSSACSNFFTGKPSYLSSFEQKDYVGAETQLQHLLKSEPKNAVLYLLELGTVAFDSGNYLKAVEYFSKAEKYARLVDYKDLTEDALAMLTTDNTKIFRPFDYERIMINVYLSLAYLLLGKYEDAVVESRRINNLIRVLKQKGLKKIDELSVAWFISALSYKLMGKITDAKIDYGKTRLAPEILKYKKFLIVSTDWVPIKTVDYNRQLPVLKYRGYCGRLIVNNKQALLIENLVQVATNNFNERVGWLATKNLLKTLLHGAIAVGVAKATKSEAAGIATFFLLSSFNRPDIRSWRTLAGCFYAFPINENTKTADINYMTRRGIKHLTIDLKDVNVNYIRIF